LVVAIQGRSSGDDARELVVSERIGSAAASETRAIDAAKESRTVLMAISLRWD
jgi:hypothetical protein